MAYSRIRFEIQNSATMTLVHCLVVTVLGMHEPALVPVKDSKGLRCLTEDILHYAAPDSRRALERQCRKLIGGDRRGRRDVP